MSHELGSMEIGFFDGHFPFSFVSFYTNRGFLFLPKRWLFISDLEIGGHTNA